MARLLHNYGGMKAIGEDIKEHVSEILVRWEQLVREQPWYSLPADHRIDNLSDVLVGMVNVALCYPHDISAHRQKVEAACDHGWNRREQGIPEYLMLTEYHLLRQALWYYLVEKFGTSATITKAIVRFDIAVSMATNASMWGYHRPEIEALGKWEEGIQKIINSSPFLQEGVR